MPASPSAPSSGGGDGRRGTAVSGVDAFALVQWVPEMLVLRTATAPTAPGGDAGGDVRRWDGSTGPSPGPGEAPAGGQGASPGSNPPAGGDASAKGGPAAGGDGAAAAKDGAARERRHLRGLRYPRGETRPMLVYFHWPHEDGPRGKEIVRFCSGPLEDGDFGRVSWLFHCVEVNTRDSAPRLVEEAGIRVTPTLAVCRPDGEIVWKSEDRGLSGKALAAALTAVMKKEFPAEWKAAELEQERQREALKAAETHLRRGEVDEGIGVLRGIVESNVRIGAAWEAAVKALQAAEAKQARPK